MLLSDPLDSICGMFMLFHAFSTMSILPISSLKSLSQRLNMWLELSRWSELPSSFSTHNVGLCCFPIVKVVAWFYMSLLASLTRKCEQIWKAVHFSLSWVLSVHLSGFDVSSGHQSHCCCREAGSAPLALLLRFCLFTWLEMMCLLGDKAVTIFVAAAVVGKQALRFILFLMPGPMHDSVYLYWLHYSVKFQWWLLQLTKTSQNIHLGSP